MLVHFIVRKGCPVVGGRGEKFLEDFAVFFVGYESLAGFRCHSTSNLWPRVVAVVNVGWRSQTVCKIFAVERIFKSDARQRMSKGLRCWYQRTFFPATSRLNKKVPTLTSSDLYVQPTSGASLIPGIPFSLTYTLSKKLPNR